MNMLYIMLYYIMKINLFVGSRNNSVIHYFRKYFKCKKTAFTAKVARMNRVMTNNIRSFKNICKTFFKSKLK